MPEADRHYDDLHTGVTMLTYTNEQARDYTRFIVDKQGAGTLHAWLTDDDPVVHAQKILNTFITASHGTTLHKVLDVGCGTGEMLFQLKEIYPSFVFAKGINIFPSQMEMVPPGSGVSFVCRDFEKNLVCVGHEGTFDLVMCNYTLGHFEQLPAVLKKMYDLLSPGGTLGIYDVGRRSIMWDEILGYHLWSRFELRDALNLAGFMCVHDWTVDTTSPDNDLTYYINDLFAGDTTEEGQKLMQEWRTKTKPVLITARKEN